MSKYSYEKKVEAVLRVIDDGMSYKESSKILGCSKSCVIEWVKKYEKYGFSGLLIKNNKYSFDFKIYVIKYMEKNGLSSREAAITFSIPSHSTILEWKKIYLEKGEEGFYNTKPKLDMKIKNKRNEDKTKEDLEKELEYLRTENAYLKKLQALIQEKKKVK